MAKGKATAKRTAKGFKNLDAKVGDFCAVRTVKSHTTAALENVERWVWDFGIVTGVTRDGWVKAFKRADDRVVTAPGPNFKDLMVLPAARLSHPVADVVDHVADLLDGVELEAAPGDRGALERFRGLLAPWRSDTESEADCKRWPNSLGWDVDRHSVVRQVDGSFRAVLLNLPEGVAAREAVSAVYEEGFVVDLEFLRGLIREAYCTPIVGQAEVAL